MKKKKLKLYIVLTMMLLLLAFTIFCCIDVHRFMNGEEPIFIIKKEHLNDGGTIIYNGVGYQLISWKIIDDSNIVGISHLVGKEYHIIFFHDIDDGPTIELKKE